MHYIDPDLLSVPNVVSHPLNYLSGVSSDVFGMGSAKIVIFYYLFNDTVSSSDCLASND
jgi:hypothetical protein